MDKQISEAARLMGSATSPAKAQSSRANGKLGGRIPAKATYSFESSDLTAKIGDFILDNDGVHGLGQYKIVAKRNIVDRPLKTYRFYLIPASQDAEWVSCEEKSQAAHAAQIAAGELFDADLKAALAADPAAAARLAHLRERKNETHGRKRHDFSYRINKLEGQLVRDHRASKI